MTEESRKGEFNTTQFLLFLVKWWKPLLIITLAAAVIAGGVSFLITPKYKSTVILFPTSTNAVSKALLSENSGPDQDVLEFGEEEQAEQLLQILNSSEIRGRVIQRFDLARHYEIDPDSKYKMTELIREYNDNITFKRTEYMAVEITVMDRDPQMAADIANTISELLDTVKNNMQRERAVNAFKIVETEYNELRAEIKELEDSLAVLRRLGVNDYETQAEAFNVQLATALSKNNNAGVRAIEERMKVLGEYGGSYVSLRDQLEHEKKQLSLIKAKYDEAKVDAQSNLPAKFVVDRAYKAEKKSYPVRWIIVSVSSISAFVLAILILLIVDGLRKKKAELTNTAT